MFRDKRSSLLKGRKLTTRNGNKQQISNMIKGTKKQHTKKPHSKLTVNDEILKTHLLQLKTRQKHWLLNTSKSPRQHEEPKRREESKFLHSAENPEHTYKLEEQVTESWTAKPVLTAVCRKYKVPRINLTNNGPNLQWKKSRLSEKCQRYRSCLCVCLCVCGCGCVWERENHIWVEPAGWSAGRGCNGLGKSEVTVSWTVRCWCWLSNTGQGTEGRTKVRPRSRRRLLMEKHHRSTEKDSFPNKWCSDRIRLQ